MKVGSNKGLLYSPNDSSALEELGLIKWTVYSKGFVVGKKEDEKLRFIQ